MKNFFIFLLIIMVGIILFSAPGPDLSSLPVLDMNKILFPVGVFIVSGMENFIYSLGLGVVLWICCLVLIFH